MIATTTDSKRFLFPLLVLAAIAALSLPADDALGQDESAAAPSDTESAAAPAPQDGIGRAIEREGRRYWTDAGALYSAPLRWDASDWKKAAGFGLVLGGLFAVDAHWNRESQLHRSTQTDDASNFVRPMGGVGAVALSVALVGGGLVTGNSTAIDSGREAIEASVLTGLLTDLVLKPAFGRVRPNASGGATEFKPFSNNASFPSGESTEAFSVASVIATRAHGWVIPTVAYTVASLVAFERLNLNAHFPSDVFAGAILGVAAGKFLVARHDRRSLDESSTTSIDVVPTGRGLSVRVRF